MITEWVKEAARTPVLVKFTPNITDIRHCSARGERGGADGLSAINTINSITGIDLDTLIPRPNVDGASSHGGYCGPAVKPIALHMVQQVAADPESACRSPVLVASPDWRDAAEFILMGCQRVQLCTAPMHYGFRMVEDMIDGLRTGWMIRASAPLRIFAAGACQRPEWKNLNLNYKIIARIHEEKCIGCDLCYIACWDGAHQCIHIDRVLETGMAIMTPAVRRRSRRPSRLTPIPKLDGANQ